MYFCSKCGNLYDITNTSPVSDETTPTEQKKNSKNNSTSDNNKKIYFVCKTCGNSEIMKPKTLIISKKSHDMMKEYYGNVIKPDIIINTPTLPHTRDYICPSITCPTQSNPKIRDAVMTRIGNSYKMQYICTICKTMWIKK
jgi:acetone carboxylase gamma subunit